MENKEFNIKSLSQTFRVSKISPIELLSLQTQINFEDFKLTSNLFTFILEHLEVRVMDVWVPVKEKNKEEYNPKGIENNIKALNELIMWFLDNIIKDTFINSSK